MGQKIPFQAKPNALEVRDYIIQMILCLAEMARECGDDNLSDRLKDAACTHLDQHPGEDLHSF